MKKFVHLDKLLPYIDDAFASFYDAMLNDIRLSVFFENNSQVLALIEKQKQSFVYSLHLSKTPLKKMYTALGEFHYDIRIPYVDFIKGTDILEEYLLLSTQKAEHSIELMDEIFEYFKVMKAFTAKGYLNRMLEEDKRDLASFFEQNTVEMTTYLPKNIVLEKIRWLKDLLHSIESDGEFNIETNDSLLKEWLNQVDFLTLQKRNFFEDLEQRILINTQNLFYFLKREEYLEILPLYTSLLNIYKLTLMMNNAVTLEYAKHIIEDMQLDSLTQLFRKDLLEELLKKEMALVQRQEVYRISIAYIDLDNFKGVNDTYGHYSGDKVIEKIGEVIRENIRASDMGFRIGGDEFAIILKNATKKQAKAVCSKIQTEFTSFEFVFNEELTFNVSISIGICEFPHASKKDMKDLLESVDKKLYEAKHAGKNQIVIQS